MSSWAPKPRERGNDARFSEDALVVDLIDGRTISVPILWYPRLARATKEQRSNWEIAGGGFGIHWPDIDEDLSTEGLLRGAPRAADIPSVKRKGFLSRVLTQSPEWGRDPGEEDDSSLWLQ